MKDLKLFWRVLLCLALCCLSMQNQPNVYWSMNRGNNEVIYPDIGDRQIYNLNVKPQERGFKQGVDGKDALHLNHSNVQTNGIEKDSSLQHENCFQTPSTCQGGLSLEMWMKIESLSTRLCVFSSSASCFELSSGVAFRLVDDELTAAVTVNTVNRSFYLLQSVNLNILQINYWNHFAMIWKNNSGLKLYINGTETDSYAKDTKYNASVNSSIIFFGNMESATSVLIDEVKLWFFPISTSDLQLSIKNVLDPFSRENNLSRWLVLAVCMLTLLIMSMMVIMLFVRRKKAKRNCGVYPVHSGASYATPTSNLSSKLESSIEY